MPIVNEGVLEEMKHIANPSELKHIQEIYEKTDPLPMSISDPVLNKSSLIDKFKKSAAQYEGDDVSTFK